MFILSETSIEGLKHVEVYIHVGNVWVRLPKGPQRCPQEGPQMLSRHCLGSVNRRAQMMPRQFIETPYIWGVV